MTRRLGIRPSDLRSAINVLLESGLKPSALDILPDGTHRWRLRGTAATKFYIAGLSERVVAEIMGWEEDQVARIIRRYVSRDAATKAVIRQIDAAKKRGIIYLTPRDIRGRYLLMERIRRTLTRR